MDYLGFEVCKEGIRTSPEKVKAILDWPWPPSTHDIRSFLGLASRITENSFRGFSAVSKDLNRLRPGTRSSGAGVMLSRIVSWR